MFHIPIYSSCKFDFGQIGSTQSLQVPKLVWFYCRGSISLLLIALRSRQVRFQETIQFLGPNIIIINVSDGMRGRRINHL